MKCRICSSYAINEHLHERTPGKDVDLCDVCYWHVRAIHARVALAPFARVAEHIKSAGWVVGESSILFTTGGDIYRTGDGALITLADCQAAANALKV